MKGRKISAAGLLMLMLLTVAWAQSQSAPGKPPEQSIPDAPSAKQKPQNLPPVSPYPPAQTSPAPEQPTPQAKPAAEPSPGESSSTQSQNENPNQPPVPQVTQAQPGRTRAADENSRDEI